MVSCLQTPIVSFAVRVPSDVRPGTPLKLGDPAGGKPLVLAIPEGVAGGKLFNYHV